MEKEEIMALITKIRKEKKISQREMAEQLGISTRQYNGYENLRSIINIESFSKILNILEVDVKDFFFLKSTITKTDLNNIERQMKKMIEKLKSKLDK